MTTNRSATLVIAALASTWIGGFGAPAIANTHFDDFPSASTPAYQGLPAGTSAGQVAEMNYARSGHGEFDLGNPAADGYGDGTPPSTRQMPPGVSAGQAAALNYADSGHHAFDLGNPAADGDGGGTPPSTTVLAVGVSAGQAAEMNYTRSGHHAFDLGDPAADGYAVTAPPTGAGVPRQAIAAAPSARQNRAPAEARALLVEARAALMGNQRAAAKDRLERAETVLLNARSEGIAGYDQAVNDVAAARQALATGSREMATQRLGSALTAVVGQV